MSLTEHFKQNTIPVVQTQTYDDDEIEIDLWQLLRAFKQHILFILLAGFIGGAVVGCFSKFALTPQYQSTTMTYILSKETTLTSLADLQIGSQLTKDYRIIVTSRPVLEDVIRNLNLDMDYKELSSKITIDNPSDTRILSITAVDPDPQRAKQIADQVAKTSSNYIGDIMEMVPPKLIEDGEVPTQKSSPHNGKNAAIGALLAIFATCAIITMDVIMNDTVRTEEDVAKYLGLSVLASVPQREGENDDDKELMAKNKKSSKADQRARSRKKGRR
ncbi:MAG: Wzz/FepE/Etk N-terminal domain-containing protein [Lachnospiraceae bacterium]|nr:Wzz/FepE/Etk N-terminal domain-containing protein [Lachnospiraceae bacterium]